MRDRGGNRDRGVQGRGAGMHAQSQSVALHLTLCIQIASTNACRGVQRACLCVFALVSVCVFVYLSTCPCVCVCVCWLAAALCVVLTQPSERALRIRHVFRDDYCGFACANEVSACT